VKKLHVAIKEKTEFTWQQKKAKLLGLYMTTGFIWKHTTSEGNVFVER
jgi:hypothetical protein